MNANDLKTIEATDIQTEGNAIVAATVSNVYALDVLQAEYRAERFLSKVATDHGQVNSCDRWELVEAGDGALKTWTIKFTSTP